MPEAHRRRNENSSLEGKTREKIACTIEEEKNIEINIERVLINEVNLHMCACVCVWCMKEG